MTGTELHRVLQWSSLLGPESCRRVFLRDPGFPGLIRRLAVLGSQMIREGRIERLVGVKPGMSRREIGVAILERYLQVDVLTRLPFGMLRPLVSAGAERESLDPFSVN